MHRAPTIIPIQIKHNHYWLYDIIAKAILSIAFRIYPFTDPTSAA
jgi:hypothetical protein